MQRQLENNSKNTFLKMRYIGYFGEDQNVHVKQPELIMLLGRENNTSDKATYVNLLIKKYPGTAASFLEDLNV